MTPEELAAAAGIRATKVFGILSARHFLPMVLVEPFSKALRIRSSELITLAMLQFNPPSFIRSLFAFAEQDLMSGKGLPWHLLKGGAMSSDNDLES